MPPARVPGISYAPAPGGTEVHWIGDGSPPTRNWDTATNWDLGYYQGGSITIDGKMFVLSGVTLVNIAPLPTSTVIIAPASGVAVNGPSANTTVLSLEIGNAGGTSASSLTLVPSVAFSVTAATTVNTNAALTVNGTLTTASLVTNGAVSVSSTGNLATTGSGVTAATTVNANAALTVNGTLTTASLVTNGAVSVSSTGKLGTTGSPVGTVAVTGGETAFAGGAVVNVNTLSVNGGILRVAEGGQLGASGVTLGGGTLQLTGSAFNGSRPVTINGGAIDVPVTATIAGPIGGSAPLTKTGDGTLIVTGTGNTFSSAAVNAGTLQGNTGSIKTNVALNAAGANVTFDQTSDGAYGKVVNGDGGLTKAGAATLTISKNQTYGGSTIISGGTLKLDRPTAYPSSGLVGKWTFDDGTANDTSGNNYNGTPVNSPTYSIDTHDGKGQSLVLAGASSQYVKVDTGGSQTVFDGGNAMTISAWVKGWPSASWNPFICKNGEPNGWQMRRNSSSTTRLNWTTRGAGGDFASNPTTINSDGNWHLVTMTYDGATKIIYVDGALNLSVAATGTITPSTSMLAFGARDNGTFGNFFTGKLDDIYFFNRALSDSEVTTAYNYVSGGVIADLLPIATALRITGGSTLDLNGIAQQIASLSDYSGSGGAVTNSGKSDVTLTIGGTANTNFSGAISDGATNKVALIKSGSGTQTLSGPNTFSGGVTLAAGTLKLGSTTALGATAGTFTISGGTLDSTVVGLVNANANPITINGDFAFAGTNNLNLGIGAVSLGAAGGPSRTITVNAGTLTLGGTISNGTTATTLVKAGIGTLTTAAITAGTVNHNAGILNAASVTSTNFNVYSAANVTGAVNVGSTLVSTAGSLAAASHTGGSLGVYGSANYGTGSVNLTGAAAVGNGADAATLSAEKVVANSLTILSDGTVSVSGKTRTSVLSSLVFAGTEEAPLGKFDLGDGLLAINYTGSSPLAAIQKAIIEAFNGGNWAGNGITSQLLIDNPTGKFGIGYVDNNLLPKPFGAATPFGDYFGADDTTVLVRYTLIGDVNLDGIINDADISLVTNNIGQTGGGWLGGDVFGYDNIVNDSDISLTTNNIGQSVGQLTGGISELSAVPEPATLALLALGGLMALRRRR